MKENKMIDEIIDKFEMSRDKSDYKLQIVWRNVILMSLLHIGAVYGLVLFVTEAMYKTMVYNFFIGYSSGLGILCGAHRLWCHRSYKAKLPLQYILAFLQTMALQNDIYEWSRDHRVHHKYSETDADPHNARRGFFFSHVGWLLCKKHPEVKEKGKTIFMDDLDKDPLVQFQRKYYKPLLILIWGYIPAAIPVYFWGESWLNSVFICVIYRYVWILNMTWLVNSAAHMWGMKPYDKAINPVECYIGHLCGGEGFHNFHHTYAWDYSASEYGFTKVFNPATAVIDMFAKIGWAYDLKKVPEQSIKNKIQKSGDNSPTKPHPLKEWIVGSLSLTAAITIPIVAKSMYVIFAHHF